MTGSQDATSAASIRRAGALRRVAVGFRGKRTFDVIVAAVGGVVLLPLVCCTIGVVLMAQGRPVLFRQERLGLGGRPFHVLKFRTMAEGYQADGSPLPDEQRITRVGAVLRSLSLDELPQILNVLKGDMSLVGPRPLPVKYLERFDQWHLERFDVRPGLTGLAQVNGRNSTTWDERLTFDRVYAREVSLSLDLRILAKTLPVVFRRDGIAKDGFVTMPEFVGRTRGEEPSDS